MLVIYDDTYGSFNPYFTGSNSGSGSGSTLIAAENRFNPYFTGSNSGRKTSMK